MTAERATAPPAAPGPDRTAPARPTAPDRAGAPGVRPSVAPAPAPAAGTGAAADPARQVLVRCLAWVDGHREGFVLPDDVLEPYTDVNRTLKPLGELAQLCSTVHRTTAPDDPCHALAGDLVGHAWREVREGGLLLDLLRSEPFATYPFEIYAAFAGHGLRHAGFEALARTLAGTRGWTHTEQHANRQLGVLNSERRVGVPAHTDAGAVLRRTWLGGLSEPWTLERSSGYALTHTVFHVADWGLAPERLPADLDAYLRTWLPAWIDGCLEGAQWDLGAELVAVAACLPGPPADSVFEAAWPVLAAVQDPGGSLPETGAPAGRAAAGEPGAPDPYPFLGCYHSTLVTSFAAALTLACLRAAGGPAGSGAAAGSGAPARSGRSAVETGRRESA
ncbi:DUF6895 family protein [uncultured Streptomyces sp.]|uniref:DUF6895 family protein n=1 Tax=uncultured Streptomyces sp. TaxID=174707 RepID=UPI002617EB86|nr:hypothetical protein [uncultured Streptomyces sp.]